MKEKIKHILEKRKHIDLQRKGAAPAAVLIPIFCEYGANRVLFTKRTSLVRHHKGQISFPGGVQHHPNEPLEQTALRETFEEIGVAPEDIEILGRLDQIVTVTNYVVTPFVGLIPHPYEFKLNPDEVEEILAPTLSFILNPKNMISATVEYEGGFLETDQYHYQGHIIWGATARIIKILRETLQEHDILIEGCIR